MLRLQVDAPLDWILKGAIALLQQRHGLGIGNALEGVVDDVVGGGQHRVVDAIVEEGHILRALLQYRVEDVLEKFFGQIHVAHQVAEGSFGLHHPKLGQVTGGIGIFGPKGGAKGVHVGKGHGHDFGFELAADGQVGGFTKEVLAVVNPPVRALGWVGQIQPRHGKHFPCPLAVAGGNDGGMDPQKALLVEELVNGLGAGVAHAKDGSEGVGARSQMPQRPQILKGVPLFLEGVGLTVRRAEDGDGFPLQFHPLALTGRLHQGATNGHRRPGGEVFDHGVVVRQVGVEHHLQARHGGAIVHLHKGEALGLALGAYPALDGGALAGFAVVQNVSDAGHGGAGRKGSSWLVTYSDLRQGDGAMNAYRYRNMPLK